MTQYLVFAQFDTTGEFNWQYITTTEARSSRAAIASAAGHLEEDDISKPTFFAATPERSWNPVKVSLETKKSLKFSL